MVKRERALDAVFSALSDPTRRNILEQLTKGELTAGQIAASFSVSQPAVSKHLKILERCGLLTRTIVGREHYCRLSPRGMHSAAAWLEDQERYWNATFNRLDNYLARPTEETK